MWMVWIGVGIVVGAAFGMSGGIRLGKSIADTVIRTHAKDEGSRDELLWHLWH